MGLLERYLDRTEFVDYDDFYNNYKVNIPENFNFAYDIVDEWAKIEPEKKALLWCDDNGNELTLNYRQLSDLSQQAANFFVSMGIKKGDFVMLVLKRHHEFWPAVLALHRIGAIGVPATHLLTVKDYVYRFESANVSAIIATSDGIVCDNIDQAQLQCPTLKTKILCRGDREGWVNFDKGLTEHTPLFPRPTGDAATNNDDTMLLYFTSGTTGYPKMVHHNFVYPLGHITTAKYWQCVEEDKPHLTVADTGWAKSVWGKLYGQMICGSIVFVYDYSERFTPIDLLKKIEQYKIATFCAPPTIFRFFIKADLTQFDLSSLKYCVVAGEPLNPEVYNQFLNATGIKLYEGFGQTETVVTIATFKWLEPHPGSMGRPCAGTVLELLNDQGELCDPGDTGELTYNTSERMPYGMFKGYYKDDNRTKEVWSDGCYRTGDLAWCDEDGFYWFVGRTDDIIKSSGYRIGPFEVESALMEHPAVMETAITAVPDELRGQIVKASVILAAGYTGSPELAKELQNHVKQLTAPYKYPRIVEFVDKLPKTISGKIRRVEIRQTTQSTTDH